MNDLNQIEYEQTRSPRRHRRSLSRHIRSRSRSRSAHRYRSRSRSRSRYYTRYSRERSPVRSTRSRRSYDLDHRLSESDRMNPPRNKILAVFGLDRNATEHDLDNMFRKYGCNYTKVIFDKKTGQPRGFGFVYFDNIKDASRARHATNGKLILSREIRVDYSIGEKNNSPSSRNQSSSQYRGKDHHSRHSYN